MRLMLHMMEGNLQREHVIDVQVVGCPLKTLVGTWQIKIHPISNLGPTGSILYQAPRPPATPCNSLDNPKFPKQTPNTNKQLYLDFNPVSIDPLLGTPIISHRISNKAGPCSCQTPFLPLEIIIRFLTLSTLTSLHISPTTQPLTPAATTQGCLQTHSHPPLNLLWPTSFAHINPKQHYLDLLLQTRDCARRVTDDHPAYIACPPLASPSPLA